jgi:predicted metal-dependent hydrolase
MQKRFTYEQVAFDYDLTLEARKTIAVTVLPDQSVRVKAPLHATEEKINGFLQRKFRWVLKHQRYFARFKPRAKKEYISGETFRYLGRNYKLLVRKSSEHERVSIQQGTLTVFSLFPQNRLHTKKLLDAWYVEKARQHFVERLQLCAAQFAQKTSLGLVIRPMIRRWGSYSRKTGRICLNLALIKASRHQIDYVLTHELCHVTHTAHDKAFYRLLSSHFPDWKKVKTELEQSLV